MNLFKSIICGISCLTMCLSFTGLSADAATTTYKKGDVNGDGTVNSQDTLCAKQFLLGRVGANGKTSERLDADKNYIIDQNDVTIIKNIVLGLSSGGTDNYDNIADLPSQEARTYYRYDPVTGNYKSKYTLNIVPNISSSTSSVSTYSILDGIDDRWAEDGLDGVINIQNSDNYNIGTAFVVDSHTIITAAHCLYSNGKGNDSEAKDALQFKIFNEYNVEIDIPITPTEYQICQKYVDIQADGKHDKNYDYAIITVKEDLSQYVNFNLGIARNELYTDNVSSKKLLFITGFGGDGRTQLDKNAIINSNTTNLIDNKSTGDGFLVNVPTSYKLNYDIDTVAGDSGGPVYAFIQGKQTVIGIHTDSLTNDEKYNKGIRITTDILNFIYNHK